LSQLKLKKVFNLRNKPVAEALYLTNNIEKYGRGFIRIRIRIRKALQDYPETAFAIQEMGGGVLLTFARTEKSSEKNTLLFRKQYE
jgi:predicted HTH transcriptional regulator